MEDDRPGRSGGYKAPQDHSFHKIFGSSFLTSFALTALIMYLWYEKRSLWSDPTARVPVIILFVLVIGLCVYEVLRTSERKDLLWWMKMTVAAIGVFLIIFVINLNAYMPPFVFLFYAIFASAVLTINGFVTLPSNRKVAYASIWLGSLFPMLTPLLFYILYQIVDMPHIIEVAGICHAGVDPDDKCANVAIQKNTRMKLARVLFDARRARLGIELSRKGGVIGK